MNWFKKFLGAPPVDTPETEAPVLGAPETLDELIDENLRLGAMQDDIRERRKDLQKRIASKLDGGE